MIDLYANPRPDIPPPTWKRLEELNELFLPVMGNFVHACSEDPNERTLAVTSLVTSLCQLCGRRMMRRMPSTLIVNAYDLENDPIDMLAGLLIPPTSEPVSGYSRHPGFLGGTAKDAPWAMAQAIMMKDRLGAVTPINADTHRSWENRYFSAQSAGFGSGPSRPYAEAWHDTFELMTDHGDELILRIESPEDRMRFRKDVVEGAHRLRAPIGYGTNLTLVTKHIGISGSLASREWDTSFATSLVDLGLPLLILPSLATSGPWTKDAFLRFIAGHMPRAFDDPVDEPANLPPSPWFDQYNGELRSRLRHLSAAYDYSMQKLARQLYPACVRIANWCGTFSNGSTEEILALAKDLHQHSVRGLVLGVAGLAWHGLGIDTVVPRAEFLRVLSYVRRKGEVSKSDLLRHGKLSDSTTRDRLVERFEAEGLARVDGKVVTATSYGEFVEDLYGRPELPHPEDHWARLTGKGRSAVGGL